ncbi:hypothetical protein Pelo_765 [Pelomyxa schiedti]|nr:hypothetical protein Pelo_765 [Pelomyxa schiedti]
MLLRCRGCVVRRSVVWCQVVANFQGNLVAYVIFPRSFSINLLPLMWNCRLPSAALKVNEPRAAAQRKREPD